MVKRPPKESNMVNNKEASMNWKKAIE
jgi:hypothetical protein